MVRLKGVDYAEIDGEHIAQTDLALLLNDGEKEDWIPKSLMKEWPEEKGDVGTAMVQEWFAIQEGWV